MMTPAESRSEVFTNWMRLNARRRLEKIQAHVVGKSLLDVGAAEGWAGEWAQAQLGLQVDLVDVVDLNRTDLPLHLYDGRHLPFPDKSYDTVMLLLVLHHCDDPSRVLAESVRVARKRIIITESICRTRAGRAFLTFLDKGFNGFRSTGAMSPALHFKTVREWRVFFTQHGLASKAEAWLSRGLHEQRLFILDLPRVGAEEPKLEPREGLASF
jgi:SAM-dependent methyltransferase